METQPSQYLKHVDMAAFLDGTLHRGDWAIDDFPIGGAPT